MEQDERILLMQRRLDAQQSREQTLWVLVAAIVVGLLVLVPTYRALARQSLRRARVEMQLRDLAENLPVTVYQFHTRCGGDRVSSVSAAVSRDCSAYRTKR